MRNEQIQFQTNLKSSLMGLHSGHRHQHHKAEVSNHPPGSSSLGMNSGLVGLDENRRGMGNRYADTWVFASGGFVGGGSSGGPGNWHFRKLDIPVFDGTYLYG